MLKQQFSRYNNLYREVNSSLLVSNVRDY